MTTTINQLDPNPSLSLTDNMVTQKPSDGEVNYNNQIQDLLNFIGPNLISNPSNNLYWAPDQFSANGTVANGSAVVTDIGSTSRMYVGMTVQNSVFPLSSAIILSIDSSTQITVDGNSNYSGSITLTCLTDREGSDTTGTGQLTKPFKTYEKARQRAIDLGAGQGNSFNLIFVGGTNISLGSWTISPYVNISFNNAYVSFDEIVVDDLWETGGGDGICIIYDMTPISNISMDFSDQPSFYKTIIFNNVGINNPSFDWEFIGTGKEIFFWPDLINTQFGYNYLNSLSFENFSGIINPLIGTESGITNQNSTVNGTQFYINGDSFGPITIRSIDGAGNLLRTAGNIADGDITIDGSNCFWQPGSGSYKKPTLLNGGSVAWDSIQQAIWPIVTANYTGPITPGPGGTAVISGSGDLDNYSAFTNNVGYTIVVGQNGFYEASYKANTSTTVNGNYSMNLFLDNSGTPIDDSSTEEQQDFITIGGTLVKTLTGFVTFQAAAGDVISLKAKNNGDMDVAINEATWSLKRVY